MNTYPREPASGKGDISGEGTWDEASVAGEVR